MSPGRGSSVLIMFMCVTVQPKKNCNDPVLYIKNANRLNHHYSLQERTQKIFNHIAAKP